MFQVIRFLAITHVSNRSLCTGNYVEMINAITNALSSSSIQWKEELVTQITVAMHEQVSSLLETVKQTDSALQRRAKIRSTAASNSTTEGTNNMTDSDKIFLQVKLDVIGYGEEMKSLGIDPTSIAVYQTLLQEVTTAAQQS